jgi:hypothetical protein
VRHPEGPRFTNGRGILACSTEALHLDNGLTQDDANIKNAD